MFLYDEWDCPYCYKPNDYETDTDEYNFKIEAVCNSCGNKIKLIFVNSYIVDCETL